MAAIPESAIVGLLPRFAGYEYSLGQARYPYPLPGVSVPLEPPKFNNCCTFVEALLVKAWADTHAGQFDWSMQRHRQMMIISTDDMYSPVTAVIEAGMGIGIPPEQVQPWTIVQGWRSSALTDGEWLGGHTFLILDVEPATRRILTLESNKAYGMNGPGFRAHGDLDSFAGQHPGSRWFDKPGLWSWDRFRSVYPHMKLAKLNVYDVGWVAAGG